MNFKIDKAPPEQGEVDSFRHLDHIKNESGNPLKTEHALENHLPLKSGDTLINESISSRLNYFNCDLCAYKSLKKCDFMKHVSSVHQKLKTSCPECGKYIVNIAEHIKLIHRKERRFQCQECSYRSCFRNDLKKHVDSVHRKLKQPCPECGKEIVNVAEHVRLIHKRISRFECKMCAYTAHKKQDLTKHVDAVHKKYLEAIECVFV